MSIYEDLGIRTIINLSGGSTRVGGALMPREVAEAMSRAAEESVSMVELQAAASRYIAEVTGAEAGYVTAGASAGLTLGTAAILAGLDPGRMERLPDTTGMKNEFIISREQRNGYDHAIRLAGARLVEVGMNEQVAGAGVRRTEAWEYEAAITDRTAGITYTVATDSQPPLEQVITVARRHGLPVLVDAAGQLPPASNLRKFTEMGADLVAFSGGKAIRGPQSSGILCGRSEHIASVALQHLDMDEYLAVWDPPDDFIPKSLIVGMPRHGIGRGFKVAKEEVVGLLTALRLFVEGKYRTEFDQQRKHLEYIADGLSGLPVEPRVILPNGEGYPLLHLMLDAQTLGKSGFEVSQELRRGNPGVFVNERLLTQDTLVINPMNLNQPRTEAVTRRLRAVLSGGR
jgi:D-glucosaminate-6-phosphate ammonia-lyase